MSPVDSSVVTFKAIHLDQYSITRSFIVSLVCVRAPEILPVVNNSIAARALPSSRPINNSVVSTHKPNSPGAKGCGKFTRLPRLFWIRAINVSFGDKPDSSKSNAIILFLKLKYYLYLSDSVNFVIFVQTIKPYLFVFFKLFIS